MEPRYRCAIQLPAKWLGGSAACAIPWHVMLFRTVLDICALLGAFKCRSEIGTSRTIGMQQNLYLKPHLVLCTNFLHRCSSCRCCHHVVPCPLVQPVHPHTRGHVQDAGPRPHHGKLSHPLASWGTHLAPCRLRHFLFGHDGALRIGTYVRLPSKAHVLAFLEAGSTWDCFRCGILAAKMNHAESIHCYNYA